MFLRVKELGILNFCKFIKCRIDVFWIFTHAFMKHYFITEVPQKFNTWKVLFRCLNILLFVADARLILTLELWTIKVQDWDQTKVQWTDIRNTTKNTSFSSLHVFSPKNHRNFRENLRILCYFDHSDNSSISIVLEINMPNQCDIKFMINHKILYSHRCKLHATKRSFVRKFLSTFFLQQILKYSAWKVLPST